MSTDIMNMPTGTSTSDELSESRAGHENELRELVYQTLEREGLINRLKAQLRAAVFKTIEKATNANAAESRSTVDDGITGRVCRALVLDWLENSHLLYTEDIFKVETSGPNCPKALTRTELLEQLHINPSQPKSQPVLHLLLDQTTSRSPSTINSLPEHIKQSIDNQFPSEKINDLNRLRDHFRTLFSSAFDSTVLDAFTNKNIPSTLTSFSKRDYEQVCLKWMQACANALMPSSTTPDVPSISAIVSAVPLTRPTISNEQKPTPANRPKSPPSESSSSSSSSSSSDKQKKRTFAFTLPTTVQANKPAAKNTADLIPPPLIDFGSNSSSDEREEEDTSASVFSKRNATPAELESLKKLDALIQGGNTTPRTRTIVKNSSNNGTKDLPIEYDDESMSHSVSHSIISSVDDITVDKVPAGASTNIDYLEDF